MSLFTSLYPLAQRTTLTLLLTAEGDQLRVNVTPRASNDAKGEKTLYPLSILATPEELDADFAEAVAIYEPSIASVIDQARAASAANTDSRSAPALPAPTRGKRKPGRPPKADAATGENDSTDGTPETDPRQMSIDDATGSAGESSDTTGNAGVDAPAFTSDATATPESNAAASADAGIEAANTSAADGVDAW